MTSFAASIADRLPLYFHRLRDGETIDDVATRFNVIAELTAQGKENPQTGDIVVIDFRESRASLA
ncbi:MAG: hypothetical protein MUC35_07745 [Candidatus Margulisbacteria bacterium]|jgi:hypothetical protein|nr:hypothetical protein [Candidatus Margulisiibacteriota bacterium]